MNQLTIYHADELRAVLSFKDLIEPVAQAFIEFSAGQGNVTASVLHPNTKSSIHIKSAILEGHDVFAIKVASWSAVLLEQHKSPSSGFIAIFDSATCLPLALLQDDHFLSDIRTAAAGAVAARLLAPDSFKAAGVLGTGIQAHLQVLALAEVRCFEQLVLWGRNPQNVNHFIKRLSHDLPHLTIVTVTTPQAVVESADVILTATASRGPLIRGEWLRPGQHITAVGADDSTKAELDSVCLQRADRLIVDRRSLTQEYGDIYGAISKDEFTAEGIDGEIGEVLAGRVAGRRSNEEITIAKFIGIGVQDLAAAEIALKKLRSVL